MRLLVTDRCGLRGGERGTSGLSCGWWGEGAGGAYRGQHIEGVYLGSCVQLYSLDETPQLPPSHHIWAHIRGRFWSAKIDDPHCNPLQLADHQRSSTVHLSDRLERRIS